MTAKQKAEEMKEMYDGYIQYAERAVDQIIEVAYWGSVKDFYREVKQELENL
jgi:hypothetical protein